MVFTALWACKRAFKKFTGPYPEDFLDRVYRFLGVTEEWKICHLFSGVVEKRFKNEVTVDINPNLKPDFVEDATKTHFKDNSFDLVLADPPYNEKYAKKYGTKLPKIKDILMESVRICKKDGYIGLLHFIVPIKPKGTERVAVIGITEGANMRIRVFTLFKKTTKNVWKNHSLSDRDLKSFM